ncbi:aminoglycoside N(3)-acetyltransferase [Paenibacillus lentus]|uniref:Aminoglycoside N(3)-acetyltransferase n=1 Tax=Paenibacillus lentus TaxID=1338368 RepID=A0A3S8RU49_9BACL|nr:AAC(3) family N-acetyltransferase [Paenibacillus lentus]AZK46390.1 aminoglycoside N(3)-acetyltransferase [Paenibacillus lentus]
MEEIKGELITVDTLMQDLKKLGVQEGMTLLVHSSFKSLGQWVLGGPVSVILALEKAVGMSGTLVMPTHTPDLSDPSGWGNPPVSESWWETIRAEMPPYDEDMTPCKWMGVIPDTFRKQKGVIRSSHPQVSFAAWGANAGDIVRNHCLDNGLGESSPLARIYDRHGWVLLLGVGHESNTSLHLAEHRASYYGKKAIECKAPITREGIRQWISYTDLDYESADFGRLGVDYERSGGQAHRGKIAGADARLMPQRQLVDYGVQWLEQHRRS